MSECESREWGREGGRMWEKREGEGERTVEEEDGGMRFKHVREGEWRWRVSSLPVFWYLHLLFFSPFFPYPPPTHGSETGGTGESGSLACVCDAPVAPLLPLSPSSPVFGFV